MKRKQTFKKSQDQVLSTNLNQDKVEEGSSSPHSPSRRKFLGGLAIATAAGAIGVEPLLNSASRAYAAPPSCPLVSPDPDRVNQAYNIRVSNANRLLATGTVIQNNNDDEDTLPNFIGNYSKGLPHHQVNGEVDPEAYCDLLAALNSGDFADVPLGDGARKLTNPRAGLSFDTEGLDPQQYTLPKAPSFSSPETAGEMVELYWMALLRDANFLSYDSDLLAQAAIDEINGLSDFRGPSPVSAQTLFRDELGGPLGHPQSSLNGPYISQFMWLHTPFGADVIDRRMRTKAPGTDHMTTFSEYMKVQNGNVPGSESFINKRYYLRNGRDLSQWVHIDVLFQAYFSACLILSAINCPPNPSNPYHPDLNLKEDGFGTWGGPFFKTLLAQVATRALKAVWYQKWFVHRRLRPEECAGRIHVHQAGIKSYAGLIDPDVLGSDALARIKSKFGSYLLPMAYPEGCPTHPAYGAGHATVAGASVTILKALFDETFVIPNPVVINPAGTTLKPYSGGDLTVGGELNKVASNVATGRNLAGLHWRSDAIESLRLGEQVAIEVLKDTLATAHESFMEPISFTSFFDGEIKVEVPA